MLPDGIFFDLPEEEYLALPRLSKSGIKKLRISPADYWADSYLNPRKPIYTPEQERRHQLAMLIGKAYHCARLEPERFATEYVRELSQGDYADSEGFLATGSEMGEALEKMGIKKSGSVFEQAMRLVSNGYDGPVWYYELEQWREALAPGVTILPASVHDEIVADMRNMRQVPEIQSLLSNGYAEVSILWTDGDNIPMKARFDYLKGNTWCEVKTFANKNGKALDQTILDAVKFNRYYIDAAVYHDALEMMRFLKLDIIGKASAEQRELIDEIMLRPHPPECHFVFQQTGNVPNVLERKFHLFTPTANDEAVATLEQGGATEDRIAKAKAMREHSTIQRVRTAIHIKARMEIAAAKREYLRYSEIYEPGQAWLPWNPSGDISDADFNPNWLESLE